METIVRLSQWGSLLSANNVLQNSGGEKMLSKLKVKYKFALVACLSILIVGGVWVTASTPTFWIDGEQDENYSVSWYDPTKKASTFCVKDAKELAGVAKLVNEGVTVTESNYLSYKWGNIEKYADFETLAKAGVVEKTDEGYLIQDSFSGKTIEFCETVGGVDKPIPSVNLEGKVWVPIGTEEHPFEGILSGKSGASVEIQNMNITSIKEEKTREYVGLVGHLSSGGSVIGMKFTGGEVNLDFAADVYAGIAVGKMSDHSLVAYIENNTPITIETTGAAYVGGLVGKADDTTLVSDSVNNANVLVNSTGDASKTNQPVALLNLEEEQGNEEELADSQEEEAAPENETELVEEVEETNTSEEEKDSSLVSTASIEDVEEQQKDTDATKNLEEEPQQDENNGDDSESTNEISPDELSNEEASDSELEQDTDESNELEDSNLLEKKFLTKKKTVDYYETPHVYVGGIVGFTNGSNVKVKKIINNGTVEALGNMDVYAAGIAGYAKGTLAMDEQGTAIFNNGEITVNRANRGYAGGIVGKAEGKVTLSLNTLNTAAVNIKATLANESAAGGLFGVMGTEYPQIDIQYTNTATITNNGGTNVHTGGIIGLSEAPVNFEGLLEEPNSQGNSKVNTGKINASGDIGVFTGGIIGSIITSLDGSITNIESKGGINVTGKGSVYTGGYIGKIEAIQSNVDVTNLTLNDADNLIKVNVTEPTDTNFVATAGIVGYFDSVNSKVENDSFEGKIDVTGGTDETTFTGGIIGYLQHGKIIAANSGKTMDSYAAILADGTIGGVVGFMNKPATSIVDDATVQHIELEARSDKGVIGGLVGKTKGHIVNSTIGDASIQENNKDKEYDSVTIKAANGKKELTAGGMAGILLQEATVGEPGDIQDMTVRVKNINLVIEAPSSHIGGAIGRNQSPKVNLLVDALKMDVKTTPVNVGGVVGINDVSPEFIAEEENHTLFAKNVEITNTNQNDDVHIGGIYGENIGSTTHSHGLDLTITSGGDNIKIGGNIGVNKGSVSNSISENVVISSNGENAEVGGIAGRSIGSIERHAVVEDSLVVAKETALITTTASSTKSKLGGIVGYGERTDILHSTIKASAPVPVRILVRATEIHAGGIAGELEGSKVEGNKSKTNVEDIQISTTIPSSSPVNPGEATLNARIGGFVGYNNESRIDKVVGKKVNLIINGEQTFVGGIAGYNKGTNSNTIKGEETAIIKDSYVLELGLNTNASAQSSVVGGLVGHNDNRENDAELTDNPKEAISSIQGSRSVGTSDNKPINVKAPKAITGGLVGKNETVIANNSIADKNNITSTGAGSTLGGLVGHNSATGTIYYTYSNNNIHVEGKGTIAGGLIGVNEGQVLSSYIDIEVLGKTTNPDSYLGGLVGKNNGTINMSYTNSKVTANSPNTIVGGLVGLHEGGKVSNSYVGQQVTANGTNSYAGGFIGRITGGNVSGSYSAAEVKAAVNFQGGFIGRYDTSDKKLLSRNYYVKDANFNKNLTDFADGKFRFLDAPTRLSTIYRDDLKNRERFPTLSQWDFESVWRYASPNAAYKYPELNREANIGDEYIEDGKDDVGNIVNANINWYMVDKDNPVYEIKTEAELAGLAAIVNGMIPGLEQFDFKGREILLANEIRIQSNQWVPIGHKEETPFNGTFNGKNHLIHGLKVSKQRDDYTHDYIGLFGLIGEDGTVTNIELEADHVAGLKETGVLAGVNKGSVSNIHVNLFAGALVQGGVVGGLIGHNTEDGKLSNLTLTLDEGSRIEAIAEDSIVGGLIGKNDIELVQNIYTFNRVDGSIGSEHPGSIVGGIIGEQTGDIKNFSDEIIASYKISTTGSNNIVGGVIGRYVSGVASDITVTFKDGILEASGSGSTIGSVIGKSESGNIIKNVTVTTDNPDKEVPHISGSGHVGGLVGDKTGAGNNTFDITNLLTEGITLGTDEESNNPVVIGGIAGKLTKAAMKDATFTTTITGNMSGSVTAGGIVGEAIDSILYQVNVTPEVSITSKATSTNKHLVGGVAGTIEASNRDAALDFGFDAPLYKGIYKANVEAKELSLSGVDAQADLYLGGIVGQNNNASIYFSNLTAPLELNNGSDVYVGGIVGANKNGITVQSKVITSINADNSSKYHVGGFVGKSVGGEIHHSQVFANNEDAKISVGTAKGEDETTFVGGFIGHGDKTNISYAHTDLPVVVKCTNVENVINAGGFAGYLGSVENPDSKPMIERVYVTGDVKVSGKVMSYAGGFAGYVDHYVIKDTYVTGNVDNVGHDTRTAGFIAVVERDAVVNNSLANTKDHIKVIGTNEATRAYAGGFAAYNDGKLEGIESRLEQKNITINQIRNATDANVRNGRLVGYTYRTVAEPTEAEVLLPYGEWSTEPDALVLFDSAVGATLAKDGASTSLSVHDASGLTTAIMLYNDNVSELKYYPLFNREAEKLAISNITLEDNITLAEGKVWLPIAQFESGATFNGNGKTITGVQIINTTESGYNVRQGIYENIEDEQEYTGLFGQNEGMIDNLILPNVIMEGSSNIGAVVGANSGTIQSITLSGKTTIDGVNQLGGISGVNTGTISQAEVQDLILNGEESLSGIAETNEGTISSAGGIVGINETTGTISEGGIQTIEVIGSDITGGIAAINKGTIGSSSSAKELSSNSSVIGGIAGSNEGTISTSYNKSQFVNTNGESITLGGIAGVNKGKIEHSFSYSDLNIAAKEAKVGGIAGKSEGDESRIENVYNSGRITVKGIDDSKEVWAGGIVGHAVSGTINNAMNYSEVISSINDTIVPQQSFFGGIAGQNAGSVANSAYDKQMLKANTAYYDGDKKRAGSSDDAKGMLSTELTNGTFSGLNGNWNTVSGFYPGLTGFDQDVTKVSTAAVILDGEDVVNDVMKKFTLTTDTEVNWTSNPASALTGVLNGAKATLTAKVGEETRAIVINEPALLFIQKAVAPTATADTDKETFTETVEVTLTTTETDGEIYYTVDGTEPYPNRGTTALYTEKLVLQETTTLKAITFAEDKELSDVITHKWTKQGSFSGGGGGGIAPAPTQTTINDKPVNGEMNNGVLEANFTLTDVDLTNSKEIVISGQDSTIQGYAFRFDQTIKQQVLKDQRNIRVELPLANLVITPKMVEKMTQDLQIKVIPNNQAAQNAMGKIASSLGATLLTEGRGVTIETNAFVGNKNKSVKTSMQLPIGISATNITAVILRAENGQWTTIPWTLNGNKVDAQLTGSGSVSFIQNVTAFNDVRNGFWGEESIKEASSKLFVLGKGDNFFNPESNVTRAEYPTMLLRVAGYMHEEARSNFKDVGTNAWFNRSVGIATQMGIVNGLSETSFAPQASLTRVEAMTMVGRLLNVLEISSEISDAEVNEILNQFSDANSIPSWAKKATAISIKKGIILGENNQINPQETLTRAQAAAIAVRLNQSFMNK